MNLDATTFALEILNFAVLLWLLRRFLFKPVQAALAARAQAQQQQRDTLDARQQALEARAQALAAQEAGQAGQREAARQALVEEIAALRSQRLAALDAELRAEREKAQVRLQREASARQEQADRQLQARAAGFVGDYLKRLASPALEAALVDLFLTDLAARAEALALELSPLGRAPGAEPPTVSSAFALPEALQARIRTGLAAVLGQDVAPRWTLEPDLLAGLSVHLPGHQLETSLRRGVDAFRRLDAPTAGQTPGEG
ncbi:ATP synthase subunit B [Ideonella sp. B508-1]|uniref:ATP synthase subunit B n=1 Tax=Ideonella sp. B508-1 TaxID=137716 RepID=UPI000348DAD0|nr:ATP synthase subunit B [Ideonella sp. B508-1]